MRISLKLKVMQAVPDNDVKDLEPGYPPKQLRVRNQRLAQHLINNIL